MKVIANAAKLAGLALVVIALEIALAPIRLVHAALGGKEP